MSGRPRHRLAWTLLVLLMVALLPGGGSALGAPYCADDAEPRFQLGFSVLQTRLGDLMGEPIEFEQGNPDTGDTMQRTTTGMAYYRRSTNTLVFTDGDRHWALAPAGMVTWRG